MTLIVLTGFVVKFPFGGITWHYLQYLLGFQRLGFDVYFLENAPYPQACYDPQRYTMTDDCTYGVCFLRDAMNAFGLSKKWVFIDHSNHHYGLTENETADLFKNADALIDCSASNWLPQFARMKFKIFIDENPAYTQFRFLKKSTLKWGLNQLELYDAWFSHGMNIGNPDCSIPTCGFNWEPTRQPILLDQWPSSPQQIDGKYRTTMTWDSNGAIVYNGERYGPKNIEFQKFAELPALTSQQFELATAGIPKKEYTRLVNLGWTFVNPTTISKTPQRFQQFIQDSKAEWSVAKNAFVKTKSGWFGDRNSFYLASAKPVLLQDTGYSKYLPAGKGLVSFTTIEDALAGIDAINRDYAGHCAAARHLAETHFDSDQVLQEIITKTHL